MHRRGLAAIDRAFFDVNAWVSVAFFVLVLADELSAPLSGGLRGRRASVPRRCDHRHALALALAGLLLPAVAAADSPTPPPASSACASPGAVECPVYERYVNHKYGFSVDVPTFFVKKAGRRRRARSALRVRLEGARPRVGHVRQPADDGEAALRRLDAPRRHHLQDPRREHLGRPRQGRGAPLLHALDPRRRHHLHARDQLRPRARRRLRAHPRARSARRS